MGGVDNWFDNLDEKKVSLDDYIKSNASGSSSSQTKHKSSRLFPICIYYIHIFLKFY